MRKRPNILTIAGFDPSNGAGLTADVKTFEALKCYGFSVCTANTVQNDVDFTDCHWTSTKVILEQIECLFARFEINYVKIGIVESWEVLMLLIDKLLVLNSNIKIVLDPVLKSSSNFHFHSSNNEVLDKVLSKIFLITPNYEEIKVLYADKSIEDTISYISSKTNLFLKGGHNENAIGQDRLFTADEKQFSLQPKIKNCSEKHGSGCVLSSAITSFLSLGFPLLKSCYRGKRYTEKFLSSNNSLLGFH